VDDYNLDKANLKIAVQGFGNAGYFMAKNLHDAGYKVVAVSDSQGGIYNKDGLDIEALKNKKDGLGSVIKSDMGEVISNAEILESEIDVLVLAAMENQITTQNVDKIKASYILELANGPIDERADDELFKRGTVVVPDILANAGGVTVSYFEWAQNKTGQILDIKYLETKLVDIMAEAWQRVFKLSLEKKISFRMSAYALAIKRILVAERYRGNLK
jgi:glutamate dehydrogenase/leucine dehydrogenase